MKCDLDFQNDKMIIAERWLFIMFYQKNLRHEKAKLFICLSFHDSHGTVRRVGQVGSTICFLFPPQASGIVMPRIHQM